MTVANSVSRRNPALILDGNPSANLVVTLFKEPQLATFSVLQFYRSSLTSDPRYKHCIASFRETVLRLWLCPTGLLTLLYVLSSSVRYHRCQKFLIFYLWLWAATWMLFFSPHNYSFKDMMNVEYDKSAVKKGWYSSWSTPKESWGISGIHSPTCVQVCPRLKLCASDAMLVYRLKHTWTDTDDQKTCLISESFMNNKVSLCSA